MATHHIITSSISLSLGHAGLPSVSLRKLQFVPSGSWTGSITIQGRIKESGVAYTSLPYYRINVDGVASDNTLVSTTITGSSLITVDDSGLELTVSASSVTGGLMNIWQQSVIG